MYEQLKAFADEHGFIIQFQMVNDYTVPVLIHENDQYEQELCFIIEKQTIEEQLKSTEAALQKLKEQYDDKYN